MLSLSTTEWQFCFAVLSTECNDNRLHVIQEKIKSNKKNLINAKGILLSLV